MSAVLFVFSSLFSSLLNLLAFYVIKHNVSVSILGSTSINTSIFEIALTIHIIFGILIFVHIFSHSGIIHGSSSVFGHSSKEFFKLSILSAIESRDLRFAIFFIGVCLLVNQDLLWLLRLGNSQNLSTEIKAPNKVMTELYLSSIYDCLRQYPIAVVLAVFAALFILTFSLINLRVGRYCTVAVFFVIAVFILNRSFAGFVSVDFDVVYAVGDVSLTNAMATSV